MSGKLAGEPRDVPGSASVALKEGLNEHESGGTFWRAMYDSGDLMPVFRSQDGVRLTDVDGNEYIDTLGPFAASCLGHSPKRLVAAVSEQLGTLMHLADMPSEPRADLARELTQIAPGELKQGRVHFEVGGGPAVDLALKLAQYYTPEPQEEIISFFGGYHGRTVAAVSIAANAYYRERVPAIDRKVIRVPYPYCYRCYYDRTYPDCGVYCVRFLEKMFESSEYGVYDPSTGANLVSTLIVEPVQSHSGMIVPPPEFYQGLRRLCDRYGIVFISDAIPMSIGRSGRWFTCEHWGVTPDIITVSKSLTGGIWPLSAVIGKREIFDVWQNRADKHMGTWHGNPVGCKAAVTVIQEIKRLNLLDQVAGMGSYFKAGLEQLQTRHPMIGEVSGVGLALGIELVRNRKSKEPAAEETSRVVVESLRRGVIMLRVGYFGNRITFMPPYVIQREDIDLILDVLGESLGRVE
jgi:4-aminobutyrate aminotransferase / (S)-3-amino-2-methylpropionate transaminase / 5-aminovalerate transaminase